MNPIAKLLQQGISQIQVHAGGNPQVAQILQILGQVQALVDSLNDEQATAANLERLRQLQTQIANMNITEETLAEIQSGLNQLESQLEPMIREVLAELGLYGREAQSLLQRIGRIGL